MFQVKRTSGIWEVDFKKGGKEIFQSVYSPTIFDMDGQMYSFSVAIADPLRVILTDVECKWLYISDHMSKQMLKYVDLKAIDEIVAIEMVQYFNSINTNAISKSKLRIVS